MYWFQKCVCEFVIVCAPLLYGSLCVCVLCVWCSLKGAQSVVYWRALQQTMASSWVETAASPMRMRRTLHQTLEILQVTISLENKFLPSDWQTDFHWLNAYVRDLLRVHTSGGGTHLHHGEKSLTNQRIEKLQHAALLHFFFTNLYWEIPPPCWNWASHVPLSCSSNFIFFSSFFK